MEDKTKIIGKRIEKAPKKGFVLRNLSKTQRNALLTGGAAIGGIGMASLLATSFSFVSKDDVINDIDPDKLLNQDIDYDGV